MNITLDQLNDFNRRWANPTGVNRRFADMRYGQAFMTFFGIGSLITPLGDAWEIRGKTDTAKLQAWIADTFVDADG